MVVSELKESTVAPHMLKERLFQPPFWCDSWLTLSPHIWALAVVPMLW